MKSRTSVVSEIQFMAPVVGHLQRCRDWWMQEFLYCLPAGARKWLFGTELATLVIALDGPVVVLELQSGDKHQLGVERVDTREGLPAAMARLLELSGASQEQVNLGIRVPKERFLMREMTLPPQVMKAIDEIALQSLEKCTPLKRDEVLMGYTTALLSDRKIKVTQWIIKRSFLREVVEDLRIDYGRLAFVCARGEPAGRPPPFVVLNSKRSGTAAFGWMVRALAFSAVLLVLTVGGMRYWQQQTTLDALEVELAATKRKAQQVRALGADVLGKQDVISNLRRSNYGSPRFLEVWNELTRILPAHTWLSELRLADGAKAAESQLSISGFSSAAPSLVAIVEKSDLFDGAMLAAPVAADPVEGRERFVIQAKLSDVGGRSK